MQNFAQNLNIIVYYLLLVPVHSNSELFLVTIVEFLLFNNAKVDN